MTAHLAYMVTGIGAAVGNHLWQSTVFAVSAWLMALQLRRNRAHVRYGIWLAASVKFLIPFSLLIDLGGFLRKPQHAPLSLQTTLSSAMSVVGQPFSGLPAHPMNTQSLPEHLTVLLPEVFAGVWVCGVVTVLLIWCTRWRKIYRALHRAVPVKSGREFELLRRLETLVKVRRPIPMLRSADMMEPGIFGIFHPLMLWPDRLGERLENEHIEGILAHELVHVLRYDNLTAAIHMLVEVVFWFHPMVWWIESRMLQERERACDEAVVRLAGRPEVYAEGLLKACRFCAESPLICVSGITGADLKDRIVRIMTEHLVQKMDLSRKLLLGGVAFVSLAIPVALGLSAKLDTATAVNVNSPGPFGKPATTNKDTNLGPAPRSAQEYSSAPRNGLAYQPFADDRHAAAAVGCCALSNRDTLGFEADHRPGSSRSTSSGNRQIIDLEVVAAGVDTRRRFRHYLPVHQLGRQPARRQVHESCQHPADGACNFARLSVV